LSTIAANRLSVILASVLWFFISGHGTGSLNERSHGKLTPDLSELVKGSLFAAVLVLGIAEKLSGAANLMSMERDWVVTVAAADGRPYDLTHLNSVMRRIDLICKLIAPLLISAIISVASSVKVGVLTIAAMSALSWAVEVSCARKVWNGNPVLQRLQTTSEVENTALEPLLVHDEPMLLRRNPSLFASLSASFGHYVQNYRDYFSTNVWIPSLALSMLHLSALSYSATFITYLLNLGFSLPFITAARAVGSVVEISSTIVTPFGVEYLSKPHGHRHARLRQEEPSDEAQEPMTPDIQGDHETGLERLGLWGLTFQFLNLVRTPFLSLPRLALAMLKMKQLPVLLIILSPTFANPLVLAGPSISPSLILFGSLSLSRLGLWIYDLTTTQLTQTLVPQSQASSFSGIENSFIAVFELLQWILALVWSRPDDFRWIACVGAGSVGLATVAYAGWVRAQRGHLVHWERLKCSCVGENSTLESDVLRQRVGTSLRPRTR
jgi:iron-regulated transporter 1